MNYYFSAGYANTNAVVKGSDVENYNALLKLNLELSKKLNVGLSLRAYAATKKYLHGSIDPYGYAYNLSLIHIFLYLLFWMNPLMDWILIRFLRYAI